MVWKGTIRLAKGIDGNNSFHASRASTLPDGKQLSSRHDAIHPAPIVFVWSVEILKVDEFATKMQVCETTVWKWIGNGTLLMGRHYFQNEKTIRFPWGPDLINKLMEDCIMGLAESDVSKKSGAATSTESESVTRKMTGTDCRKPKRDSLSAATTKRPDILQPTTGTSKRRRYDKCPINPDLLKK